MTESQPTGHFKGRSRTYDRPNQDWLCGRSASDPGVCRAGPDARGRCGAAPGCAPRRDGDRWQCTRPTAAGGPCADGPQPDGACRHQPTHCAPRRSLRSWRGWLTGIALTITLGLLVVVLTGSARERLLTTGPLTLDHGVIKNCTGCHSLFGQGPAAWLNAALDADHRHRDDRLCLGCHELGTTPRHIHSRPPEAIAAVTEEVLDGHHGNPNPPLDVQLASLIFSPPDPASTEIGCGTCHREHRGAHVDIRAMSNAACQACHQVQFASISDGHPPFRHFLTARRERIIFDHVSHLKRHFLDRDFRDKAPATCVSCHGSDPTGNFMTTLSFEATCAACHRGDIGGAALAGNKGIKFLAIPGLDLIELKQRGIDIGEWPGQSDEPLTPFMVQMLRHDRHLASLLDQIGTVDMRDLRRATPDQIQAVARLAVAIKRMLADLLTGGMPMVETYLTPEVEHLSTKGSAADFGTLFGHLPAEVVRSAAERWFPHLADDLAKPLPILPATTPGGAAATMPAATGAPASSDQSDILADAPAVPPDQSDILADAPAAAPDQSDILADAPAAPPDQSDILADAPAAAPDQSDILGDAPAAPPNQSDILGGAPATPPDQSDILGGAPATPANQSDILDSASVTPPPPDAAPKLPATAAMPPAVDPERWMANGGWYRLDFALLYRPTGHADSFLRSWLEIAASQPYGQSAANREALFASFNTPRSPGACLKCHSVDGARANNGDGAAEDRIINWYARRFEPEDRGFTRFSHIPHFSLVSQYGCQTCHLLTEGAVGRSDSGFREQFRRLDPRANVVTNFDGPATRTCASCHTAEAAGDSCTQCHRYHVGRFPARSVPTRMEVMPTPPG
ncbi:MAG: hypothetical protein GC191_11260 [Azospirillum sp.]|nr:hypothetical protein [Azospirillum sp.]